MKRIFLIDKENTGTRFLKGLEALSNQDKVIVFHYSQAGSIKEEVLSALSKTKAAVEIRSMNTHTKNAMDFQICTYLGYLYSKNGTNAEYYIVSNDKGYEAAVEFIKLQLDPKIKINIIPTCVVDSKPSVLLENTLNKYPNKIRNKVLTGIKKSGTISDFHTFLQRNFKEDCNDIYKLIKPYYKELKTA